MNTKQLRQKILDLAIRGKLVPQDPNDEPASVLLERVRAEKERLIKEGKIRRDKNESKITTSDKSHYELFEIPASWTWAKLDDIGTTSIGLTYKPTDICADGVPVLRSSNIKEGKLDLDDLVRVKTSINENLLLEENDILICARNGSRRLVGKTALIPAIKERMTFGAFMAFYRSAFSRYVHYFLNSDYFRQIFESEGISTQINQLTQSMIKDTLIPLPPIEEQRRIFAAIESAFTIIDEIETYKSDLLSVIATAKSKVLSLAISGKLVAQDENDEPASVLLEQIQAERDKLSKAGKIKAVKNTAYNSHYENLPLGEVCFLVNTPEQTAGKLPYLDVRYLRGKTKAEYKNSGRLIEKNAPLILVDGENSGEVFMASEKGYQGSTFREMLVNPAYDFEFVLLVIKLHQKELRENKTGSAIPHLNKKLFAELPLPLMLIKNQKQIVNSVKLYFAILDEISSNLN